jgi:hypothetical protein
MFNKSYFPLWQAKDSLQIMREVYSNLLSFPLLTLESKLQDNDDDNINI